MPAKKAHKERVNITVDPDVHRKFTSTADSQGMSVSGILNNMMRLYVSLDSGTPHISNSPVAERLRAVLGGNSKKYEFQANVGYIAHQADYQALDIDDTDPFNIREIPSHMVDSWIGDQGKLRIGIKCVSDLNEKPDLVLGQALMMRGQLNCDLVHIVVPHITGLHENILKTIKQANLSIVSIDNLANLINKKRRGTSQPVESTIEAEINQNLDNQWEERPIKKQPIKRKIKMSETESEMPRPVKKRKRKIEL